MNIPGKPTSQPIEFNRENFDRLIEKVESQENLLDQYRENRRLRIKKEFVEKQIQKLSTK